MSCVWACVQKHAPRFYIYSRYHFVWVVCAVIYINKSESQIQIMASVLDLNCWKRVVCAPFYICAVNIKSYGLWDFY